MLKYKQMTEEFYAQQEEKGKKLASDYEIAKSKPMISIEDP